MFAYVEPTSAEEVVAVLAEHGDEARPIAGGTAMALLLKQGLIAPKLLVGLRAAGLDAIERAPDGSLRVGAMVTHRAIEQADAVRDYSPALSETFRRISTPRIRSQGTVGGNLAHADPAQDPPPTLMALEATVEVIGSNGQRRIPLSDLFADYYETVLHPGEVIVAVRFPPRPPKAMAVYCKFLPRTHDDYATVGIAVSGFRGPEGTWTNMRIAAGAVGVPRRLETAEAVIEGTHLDPAVTQAAAERARDAVEPISDLRGSADYKREMTRVWVQRALDELAGRRNAAVSARA